jgi:hypothetical protein
MLFYEVTEDHFNAGNLISVSLICPNKYYLKTLSKFIHFILGILFDVNLSYRITTELVIYRIQPGSVEANSEVFQQECSSL